MKIYKVTLQDKQTNAVVRVDYIKDQLKANARKAAILAGLKEILGSNPAERYEVSLNEIDVEE